MATYVEGLIDSELRRATEGVVIAMNQVITEATTVGADGGSRMYINYQTTIGEHITAYGDMLRDRFARFDAKHAPITADDFDKAIASIDTLATAAVGDYERRRQNSAKSGRGYGLPIDEPRLLAVITGAQNELRGLLAQFNSQRSIVLRIRDGLIEALGQHTALALWTALAFGFGYAFNALIGWLT